MMSHFTSIVDRLTLDDIEILNNLSRHDCNSRFSAKTREKLIKETKLNESKIRKCIIRLEAMNFIEVVTGNRKHLMFVNEFGQKAIQNIFERSNV